MQLQAGFCFDSIKELLTKEYPKNKVDALLKRNSYFDLEIRSAENTVNHIDDPELVSLLNVIDNILSRGLPTRTPFELEATILSAHNLFSLDPKSLEIGSLENNGLTHWGKENIHLLWRALHFIDPNLQINQVLQNSQLEAELESDYEQQFIQYLIDSPEISPVWIHLIENQRLVSHIIEHSTVDISKNEQQSFISQRLDFSIEYPYQDHHQYGSIIEIDGVQHKDLNQDFLDRKRDQFFKKIAWGDTLRIPTDQFDNLAQYDKYFQAWQTHECFNIYQRNLTEPLCESIDGTTALNIAVSPFAIARIQKTIIYAITHGYLDIFAEKWQLAIIENDVTCAQYAIESLKQTFEIIFGLSGKANPLPNIQLHIQSHNQYSSEMHSLERDQRYDLCIDLSILQSRTVRNCHSTTSAKHHFFISSVNSINSHRTLKSSQRLKYLPLGKKDESDQYFIEDPIQITLLEQLISDIFRKKHLRPGQAEIINLALQGLDVIGLLPTGSGKSLTYQVAAFLQPGCSLVIDPIKSLMQDQFDGLLRNNIDSTCYINSSLTTEERENTLQNFSNGHYQFVFVSPERLQVETFREHLKSIIHLKKQFFGYCVIDEAHCVSEWGHDFRTAYLRLGENLRTFCEDSDGSPPFIALTATASYDVLSDIQRDLKLHHHNAIVRLDNLERPEIQYHIVNVSYPQTGIMRHSLDSKKILGKSKQQALIDTIKNIPKIYQSFMQNESLINDANTKLHSNILINNISQENFFDFKDRNSNAGLIFCPHRKWLFGVLDNASNIGQSFANLSLSTFIGSDGDSSRDQQNSTAQTQFVNHKLDLLVATKAFGMGIDKPNIRYIIHYNYPSSIESYYQEAGRAGRDRKLSVGIILFNQQKLSGSEFIETTSETGEIVEEEISYESTIDFELLASFHRNNFKGIAKEKWLLHELLTEIEWPLRSFSEELTHKIIDRFGDITFTINITQNNKNRHVMYINPDYGSIYLDRPQLTYYAGEQTLPSEIVNTIRLLIQEHQKNGTFNLQSHETVKSKGLEVILTEANQQPFSLAIPLKNNGFNNIVNFLKLQNIEISLETVHKAYAFCPNKFEFIDKLHSTTLFQPDEKIHKMLGILFNKVRTEEDTYKAVYRLSILGAIQDYTVDYHTGMINIIAKKQTEGTYTENLKKYLLLYNSKEKTERNLQRLHHYKGQSELQRCLAFLIKFIYDEIAKQRRSSIYAMEEACKVGLEKGNLAFKEYIDLYMNSKYARPQYLPEDTDKGLEASFDIVKKYIRLVREEVGEINNLKHLRGATTQLLVQRPDNYSFLLLKCFATLILEKNNPKLLNDAYQNFIDGFSHMQRMDSLSMSALKEYISEYKQLINQFDSEVSTHLETAEELFYIAGHKNWLEQFNKQFIGNLHGQ